MELMIFILLIMGLVKLLNAAKAKTETAGRQQKVTYEMPKRTERTTSPRVQVQQQNSKWQQAARENIEKAKQRAQRNAKTVGQKEEMPAKEQIQAGRRAAQNTSILERAKVNAAEGQKDITLNMLEAEHNHSERAAPAEHYHLEDIMPENVLGTVEDLMVKGYDGNLCFERDFLGEAMDMISRFTVPSEVPDFSKENEVA